MATPNQHHDAILRVRSIGATLIRHMDDHRGQLLGNTAAGREFDRLYNEWTRERRDAGDAQAIMPSEISSPRTSDDRNLEGTTMKTEQEMNALSDSLVKDIDRSILWARIVTAWLVLLSGMVTYLLFKVL